MCQHGHPDKAGMYTAGRPGAASTFSESAALHTTFWRSCLASDPCSHSISRFLLVRPQSVPSRTMAGVLDLAAYSTLDGRIVRTAQKIRMLHKRMFRETIHRSGHRHRTPLRAPFLSCVCLVSGRFGVCLTLTANGRFRYPAGRSRVRPASAPRMTARLAQPPVPVDAGSYPSVHRAAACCADRKRRG